MTVTALLGLLSYVKKAGTGWVARCPAHEDKSPSLSVSEGADGRILVNCHAGCTAEAICGALKIKIADLMPNDRKEKSRIVAEYNYTDERGELLFQVVRYNPKDFRQRKPDGRGGWEYKTAGVRRVLYRLPKIIAALKNGFPVLICEGEKDVHALEKHGFTATCNPGGAGKWLDEYTETLRDADVVIVPDNDDPGQKHAELVAGKLKGIARNVRMITLPKGKDAHDYFTAGGTAEQFVELIDNAPSGKPPEAKSLFDLQSRREADPDELIHDRYLCRGGGMLLVAPTGVGKSVLAMQMQISFALGRECFGIRPSRPLASLLIQAENDEGDLAEMRDGIIHGLHLSPTEINTVKSRVLVFTEDAKTGRELVALADRLLGTNQADLLCLDPALSYLGGEANSQKDVGGFLRNLLNPVIHRHGCGCVLVHHTNKPPTGKEKTDWQAGDFAYLGAGSAEWANWARAVLALRSIGSHDVYELRAGKRGSRLGWKDEDGSHSYARLIGHSTDGHIYWRDASEDELNRGGRPKDHNAEDMLGLLPAEGLSSTEWQRLAKTECGISERSFFRERKVLEKAERIIKSTTSGKWQPTTKRA